MATMELIAAGGRLSLQHALPFLKRDSPTFYEEASRAGGVVLSLIIVFATSRTSLDTYMIEFHVIKGRIAPSKPEGCDGICLFVIGEPKSKEYVAAHMETWKGGNPVPIIDKLMQIGEAIAILRTCQASLN